MADKAFGTNDSETAKLWSMELFRETIAKTYFKRYSGEDADMPVQVKRETSKASGDRVTVTLRGLLTGMGVASNGQKEGNEEAATVYSDNLYIDQLDHSMRSNNVGTIDDQRVSFSLREEHRDALSDWWAERLDRALFNQLAGYTATSGAETQFLGSDTRVTGMQATIAPTTSRHLIAGGQANDQSLTAADTLTLRMIDQAVARAMTKPTTTSAPRIRPIKVGGSGVNYLCFIHPYQVYSLRADAETAGNWFDIQLAAMKGGETTKNPIFTGGDVVGLYNGVLICQSEYVPYGVHNSTSAAQTSVRRAVFCGAQAACVAYGKGFGGGQMKWVEKLFDYDSAAGTDSRLIFGIKKTQFNSIDFGTIVLSTYAAQP